MVHTNSLRQQNLLHSANLWRPFPPAPSFFSAWVYLCCHTEFLKKNHSSLSQCKQAECRKKKPSCILFSCATAFLYILYVCVRFLLRDGLCAAPGMKRAEEEKKSMPDADYDDSHSLPAATDSQTGLHIFLNMCFSYFFSASYKRPIRGWE